MKTELIDVSPTQKEIKIEIATKAVNESYDRVSDRYAKQAKVPGFRPGHAPRSVVRSRFKSEIRGEVLQELVPSAVNEAIKKHELDAIGEPDVQLENAEALDKFGEQPIAVKVNLEVLPKIDLKNYKGIEAGRRVRPVTDTNVDEMLEALRETSAAMQPVEDRASESGDTVTVSVDGTFLDEPETEHVKADDVEVTLGGEGVQQEFTDNLTGVKADDEKTFTVSYPEDFSAKDLAGKRVEYTTKVSAVRVKELPEADDEWAKSLGEDFESLANLKTKIREDMEKRAAMEADHRLRAELMSKLIEVNPFEVPPSMVDHQTNRRLETVVRDMISKGVDPRNQEMNWEGAREELKAQAEADVRGSLLLERIADEEKISVSDDEVEEEIQAIARNSKQPIAQVRSVLTKDGGERSIADRLRNRKALDLLVENASVTDEEWREEKQEPEVRTQESE
ncbi:MAG TPA: trigger factor [Pyrinomonadaceae bacterium]|nr:trigger factor [Pyrinomonadaceae bacterium]